MNSLLTEAKSIVATALHRGWVHPAKPEQFTSNPKIREMLLLRRHANIAKGLAHNGRPRKRGLRPEFIGLKGQAYDTKYQQLRRSRKLFLRNK
jgi:hypothetical protein